MLSSPSRILTSLLLHFHFYRLAKPKIKIDDMRAHKAFWVFAAESRKRKHQRVRRFYCDGCRKRCDDEWLKTHPGQDMRKKWLKLEESERTRRMRETSDPTWLADNASGIHDGRTQKRRRLDEPVMQQQPAAASSNTTERECIRCSRTFTTIKEGPETESSTPTLTPVAEIIDSDRDATTNAVGNDVADQDASIEHVEDDQASPRSLPRELDPMAVAKLLFENGLPLDPLSASTVSACFPAQWLPTEEAVSGSLLDGWYDQLRSDAVEDLRADKHVVLHVITDYGATGGFAESLDGRITLLLSTPRSPRPIYWTSVKMVSKPSDETSLLNSDGRRPAPTIMSDKIDHVIVDVNQLLGNDGSIVVTVTDGSEVDDSTTSLTSSTKHLAAGAAVTNVVRSMIGDVIRVIRAHGSKDGVTDWVLSKAKCLAAFISKHHLLLKLMRSPSSKSPILLLVREGFLDCSFGDVVDNKDAIIAAFENDELMAAFVPSELSDAREIAANPDFWNLADRLKELLEPFGACLQAVGSDLGVLSHSYNAVLTLRWHDVYSTPTVGIPIEIQSSIRERVNECWQELRSSGLVGVAFLLDPHFSADEFDDDDCDTAILNAVRLVEETDAGFADSDAKEKYKATLIKFVSKTMQWTPTQKTKARACSAYEWWRHIRLFPLLQDLALKVFSIPTAVSPAEAVHCEAKVTRRAYKSSGLCDSKMEKLVFVRSQL